MRHQFTMKAWLVAALAAGAFGGAALSSTQPEELPGKHDATREIPVERLQARLADRLESVKAQQVAIENAIDRLAAGDPPLEVFKEVEPMLERRTGRRPSWGKSRPDRRVSIRPASAGSMDPATEARLRDLVTEKLPSLARTLEAAEQEDPDQAKRLLRRLSPQLLWVMDVAKRDPVLAELRIREIQAGLDVMSTIKELRDAMAKSEQDRVEIETWRAMAGEVLGAHFDARLRVEQHEAQERLKRVNDRLASVETDRDSHIGQMVDQVFERIQRAQTAPVDEPGDDG